MRMSWKPGWRKNGMAGDVDEALKEILGQQAYAGLLERQGYRRDVY